MTKWFSHQRRICNPRRGFTLMEVLVVLGIAGVLLVVSFPSLVRWTDKWRIDGAARQAALHIALAKLKAVSHHYPYTVTFVQKGFQYEGVTLSQRATLVISGREELNGTLMDMNGNGTPGEGEDPLQDRRLVLVFPDKVHLANVPSVPLLGNPGPDPVRFWPSGQARMAGTSGSPLFGLYFTNDSGDWKAVTVQHSGLIDIHSWNSNSGRWLVD